MKFNQLIQTTLRLLLILSISSLSVSCASEEDIYKSKMAGGALIGVNYTGEGIQRFSVDESGGGAIGSYGISGDVCCTMYPRVWTPELKVTVEWKRSDCERQEHLCTLEAAKAGTYPKKFLKKTVPLEKYTDLGDVYVAFLPHDDVRVFVSRVSPKSEHFLLGWPQDPSETKGARQ